MLRVASLRLQADRPPARCGSSPEAALSREHPVNTVRTFTACVALVALIAACVTDQDGAAAPDNGTPVTCEDFTRGARGECNPAS